MRGREAREVNIAMRQSRMLAIGTSAPDFALPDPAGKIHALKDFASSPALLVAFICNHCPYVKHVIGGFVAFAREYSSEGLAVVAISPNDIKAYPDDAPPAMARFAHEHGFTFPYLYDESQAVAKCYQAMCTPDFFLFDRARKLVYRGQFDGSRPGGKVPVTGKDMRAAVDALLAGQSLLQDQVASAGCSIKWKAGNAPEWA
jgi:peroxiredoxin